MAVLDAMGLLGADTPFVHESLIGTRFTGRDRGADDGRRATPAIVPEIEGSAWITGEHTFVIDDDDPLDGRLSRLSRPRQRRQAVEECRARGDRAARGSGSPLSANAPSSGDHDSL